MRNANFEPDPDWKILTFLWIYSRVSQEFVFYFKSKEAKVDKMQAKADRFGYFFFWKNRGKSKPNE